MPPGELAWIGPNATQRPAPLLRAGCVVKTFSTGPNMSGVEIDRSSRGDHGWNTRGVLALAGPSAHQL